MRRALGVVVGLLTRLWLRTLRLELVLDPALGGVQDRPWVLVLWHGQQFPLLRYQRRKRTVALVSLSKDGEILAGAFPWLGLGVERGSTSRAGARGLLAVVRRLGARWDAAFAVDGPRGPRGTVHGGAAAAAARAGGVLVPFAAACAHGHTFERSWDRFQLPWPFTRVAVVLGAPLEPSSAPAALVAQAIDEATARAERALGLAAHTAPNGPPRLRET